MPNKQRASVYDGHGDDLMRKAAEDAPDRIILLPDSAPGRTPDPTGRLRVMWGQHLLEDLLAGRYRSLVCAVNAEDNSRGIIAQLAELLPTSQWDAHSITAHAAKFQSPGSGARVLKYDMDVVEVLAVLRPAASDSLALSDLETAFRIVSQMIRHHSNRLPSASVSFLDAQANRLIDRGGREPSLEAVLRTMHTAGYTGDVFPPPSMWRVAPVGVYARYPFPSTLETVRRGGS
jgi:hypothetical protein